MNLFVSDGRTHQVYDPTFEPEFEIKCSTDMMLRRAEEVCDGSDICIFDYCATGSESVANATLQLDRAHRDIEVQMGKSILLLT